MHRFTSQKKTDKHITKLQNYNEIEILKTQ